MRLAPDVAYFADTGYNAAHERCSAQTDDGGMVCGDGGRMGAVIADRVARFMERVADEPACMDEMVARMTGAVPGADGEPEYQGLPAICRDWDVPYGRVMAWLMADEQRYAIYSRALAIQAKALVADAVDIADGEGEVARDKLRIETRFKVASYHDASVYGKSDGGGAGITVVVNRGGAPASTDADAAPAVAVSADGSVRVSSDGKTLTVL